MKFSELFLNRRLYRDVTQSSETQDSTFDSSNVIPNYVSPVFSGGAAQDINTGNVPIDVFNAGAIVSPSIQTASQPNQRVTITSSGIQFFPAAAGAEIGTISSSSTIAFLNITSSSASPFEPIVITQNGANHDAITITCADSGAGSRGMYIINEGDATSLLIQNTATSAGRALYIDYIGSSSHADYALFVDNRASDVTVGARIINSNSSNSARTVEIISSGGSGNALYVQQATAGVAPIHIKQTAGTSTHFWAIFKFTGSVTDVYYWVSDGTTPNGNLSGVVGDICFNGPSGQPFYCGGGTTWTGM